MWLAGGPLSPSMQVSLWTLHCRVAEGPTNIQQVLSFFYLIQSENVIVSNCPGKLFVIGGFDGSHALRCVEVHDPARNEWRMLGSMTSSRSNAGVAMLGNTIYAVGGFDGNEFLNTMEVYNPDTDEWDDCAKAPSPLSD